MFKMVHPAFLLNHYGGAEKGVSKSKRNY